MEMALKRAIVGRRRPQNRPSGLALRGRRAYFRAMMRFFDIADHDRLPWRFTAIFRSALSRLV
jgi:hypothetical protein